jgi:hypothetical protein
VTVGLPPVVAPPGGPTTGTSIEVPGLAVGIGSGDVTVGVEPPRVPTAVLPTPPAPVLAPTGAVPVAPAAVAGASPVRTTADGVSRHDHGLHLTTHLPAAAAASRAPEPVTPSVPRSLTAVLALLGLAAGTDLVPTQGSPGAAVLEAVRGLRDRLNLGAIRTVPAGGVPPGFALLLARPG